MFGKLFTVFVAVLALQGTSGNQYDTQIENIHRGLIDEFEKIIGELANVIKNAISTAFDQLNAVLDELLTLAESIIKGVVGAFQKVMDNIFNEIAELVGKAHELQIDVSECLDSNEEALKAIPQQLFENTVECVNKEVDKAKKIVNDTKNEISKALNIVDEIWQEFKECSGITIVICWARVIAGATEKIISIPLGIAKQVAEATKLLLTVKGNLTICETKNIADATIKAAELAAEITTCIINKIGEGL